jgi:hypothetical protein
MTKLTFGPAFVQTAISVAAFTMSVLASISIVEAKPAAPVDKTGLDVLCKAEDGVYFPPTKSGVSLCAFKDGQVLVCDSKKDKCSASPAQADIKEPPKVTINEGAMNLRMLKQLNDKVNALTSQIQSLTSTLNDRRAEGTTDTPAAP